MGFEGICRPSLPPTFSKHGTTRREGGIDVFLHQGSNNRWVGRPVHRSPSRPLWENTAQIFPSSSSSFQRGSFPRGAIGRQKLRKEEEEEEWELNDSTKSGGGMINYTGRETGRGKEEERSRGTTESAKQFREKGSERPSKLTAGTKLFKRERLFPRPDTNYVPFQFPPFPPPTDLFLQPRSSA